MAGGWCCLLPSISVRPWAKTPTLGLSPYGLGFFMAEWLGSSKQWSVPPMSGCVLHYGRISKSWTDTNTSIQSKGPGIYNSHWEKRKGDDANQETLLWSSLENIHYHSRWQSQRGFGRGVHERAHPYRMSSLNKRNPQQRLIILNSLGSSWNSALFNASESTRKNDQKLSSKSGETRIMMGF